MTAGKTPLVSTTISAARCGQLALTKLRHFLLKIRHVWLLGILLSVVPACKSDYPATARQDPEVAPPKQVQTVTITKTMVERTVDVLGSLAAYDQATLSTKVPGRVARLTVDFGSVVEQGQILAQIEQRDYQLQVQQAEAALAQARVRLGLPPQGTSDHIEPEQTATVRQAQALLEDAQQSRDRLASLVEKGFIAKAEFESADAAYKVALSRLQDAKDEIHTRQAVLMQRRAELEIAKQRLADTVIRAPFDGGIQTRHASVGEYVAASAPVVTLVRMDPLRLRAEVPERSAYEVQAGQKIRVVVDGDPNIYTGHVTRMGTTINEQNRMLMVEADVRNPGTLRPGSFARVAIVTKEADPTLTVPPHAVVTFAGLEKVWLVQDGKAIEKPIVTGSRTDAWVEISDGVNAGDVIVVEPGNLRAGQAVTALP
ncbi:MAG: efflux RND transporter periplasmic adaptor subunit [Candidatus Binatia bacterium]